MARLAGGAPVIVDTPPESGFLMSAEQLEAALTPRSRVLILCTPSNPTGAVYPKELLEAIAQVVARHPRLLVLSDEIYEAIIYPPAEHHSFAALPGMWPRTLTVNGFSKAFAMTGWRLGYLAAPRHFAAAAAAIQSQSTSGASAIAQQAALAALALGPKGGAPVARMVAAFKERRDYVAGVRILDFGFFPAFSGFLLFFMYFLRYCFGFAHTLQTKHTTQTHTHRKNTNTKQRLRGIPGVRLAEPTGAFYVLPDMRDFFGPGAEAKGHGPIPDADALCMYLIQVANVAVVPGDAFGAPSCIRLSYAAGLDTLKAAMDRIERALAPGVFTRRSG
jgi:aspartate/glutamate/aspartate-prephenate aminotransferase